MMDVIFYRYNVPLTLLMRIMCGEHLMHMNVVDSVKLLINRAYVVDDRFWTSQPSIKKLVINTDFQAHTTHSLHITIMQYAIN